MLNLYQIAAVARRTGLSIDTIRAWERRYALVQPARNETGVREYSEDDIERLCLARAAVSLGHPIRRVAARSNDELRDVIAAAALPPVRGLAKTATVQTVESILDAVLHYDLALAESLLNAAVLLFSPSELVIDVLAPLMAEIGRRWEANSVTIAQEHFASNLVRGMLGSLMRIGPPKDREPMLFVTPPGELHELGVLFAASLASLHGIRAIVLGANIPAREVIAAAKAVAARGVVVGLFVRERAMEFAGYLAELRSGLPSQILCAGGPAASAVSPAALPNRTFIASSLAEFFDDLRKTLP